MATESPRPALPAAGRPEGGRGRCAGGGRGEAEEAAAQPALGASPCPAAAGGGRRRGLNGCVPLSHQVAGHMYGKDKGGERRRGELRAGPRGSTPEGFYPPTHIHSG